MNIYKALRLFQKNYGYKYFYNKNIHWCFRVQNEFGNSL